MFDEMRIDGETWAEWVARLFEDEYCAECFGDVEDHEPWVVMGHWFAHCTDASEEAYERRQALSRA
jgi:hypothetical protein